MCRNQLEAGGTMKQDKGEEKPPNSPSGRFLRNNNNSNNNNNTTATNNNSTAFSSIKSSKQSDRTGQQPYRPQQQQQQQQQQLKLRIVVVGASNVGKSALTVRYLTRRYISEYRRAIDLLYRHLLYLDDVTTEVEILDVSSKKETPLDTLKGAHSRWGQGFAVVYSIDDRSSFMQAKEILESVLKLKAPIYVPVILVANKRDLEHARKVSVEEGQALSLQHGCQFYEVSAAESHVGVTLAFQALLRETRTLQLARPPPRQRRVSMGVVSKMIGSLIGRVSEPSVTTMLSCSRPVLTTMQETPTKRVLRRKDKMRPSLSL